MPPALCLHLLCQRRQAREASTEEIPLHSGKVMRAGLREDKPICRLTMEGVICGLKEAPCARRHEAKPKWAKALPLR